MQYKSIERKRPTEEIDHMSKHADEHSETKHSETEQKKDAIVLIDDDPNNLYMLELDLENEGCELLQAENGQIGWSILQDNKDRIVAILLDRMMPVMDGMEFMEKVKTDKSAKHIPVIMQTAAAEKNQVAEGIKAGVYYYLTKPYDVQIMLSVVRNAIKDYKERCKLKREFYDFRQKLKLVKESYFEATTIEDARYLATFLANFFPNGDNAILGISELLINAIEHGNLGITYEEKTELHKINGWEEEIQRRLALPENKDKTVLAHFKRESDHITLTIKDQGNGFHWQQYMQIDPRRAKHSHCRGIAMAAMLSFDHIEYIGNGNTVICTVNTQPCPL